MWASQATTATILESVVDLGMMAACRSCAATDRRTNWRSGNKRLVLGQRHSMAVNAFRCAAIGDLR
jgi:hypothetical protein